jgi:hypothetical protein
MKGHLMDHHSMYGGRPYCC